MSTNDQNEWAQFYRLGDDLWAIARDGRWPVFRIHDDATESAIRMLAGWAWAKGLRTIEDVAGSLEFNTVAASVLSAQPGPPGLTMADIPPEYPMQRRTRILRLAEAIRKATRKGLEVNVEQAMEILGTGRRQAAYDLEAAHEVLRAQVPLRQGAGG